MHPYVFNIMHESRLQEMHTRYEKDALVKIALESSKNRKSPFIRAFNMLIVLFGFGAV